MYQGLQQTLGEVLTISDAELDGLLDCGDEVIDQLSELSSLIIISIIYIYYNFDPLIIILIIMMTLQSLQREACKQWRISRLERWRNISR